MELEKIDWVDVLEIAIKLCEKYPEIDPQWISFPDLHKKS
jgi:FeS assembly protein IscX